MITTLKNENIIHEYKDETEYNIRMAEAMISAAKQYLYKEYDKYADVQKWMNKAENLRQWTDILLSKHLHKGLE